MWHRKSGLQFARQVRQRKAMRGSGGWWLTLPISSPQFIKIRMFLRALSWRKWRRNMTQNTKRLKFWIAFPVVITPIIKRSAELCSTRWRFRQISKITLPLTSKGKYSKSFRSFSQRQLTILFGKICSPFSNSMNLPVMTSPRRDTTFCSVSLSHLLIYSIVSSFPTTSSISIGFCLISWDSSTAEERTANSAWRCPSMQPSWSGTQGTVCKFYSRLWSRCAFAEGRWGPISKY